MMERLTDIPTELYEDEVVGFLAYRYHSTPNEIVRHFLVQDGKMEETDRMLVSFTLEENEMEIMRGLVRNSET